MDGSEKLYTGMYSTSDASSFSSSQPFYIRFFLSQNPTLGCEVEHNNQLNVIYRSCASCYMLQACTYLLVMGTNL